MNFIWFKSDDGEKLEDCGILRAESEVEARDLLYDLYGYNACATCLSFINLDDEFGYKREDEQCLSIFNLFNERI